MASQRQSAEGSRDLTAISCCVSSTAAANSNIEHGAGTSIASARTTVLCTLPPPQSKACQRHEATVVLVDLVLCRYDVYPRLDTGISRAQHSTPPVWRPRGQTSRGGCLSTYISHPHPQSRGPVRKQRTKRGISTLLLRARHAPANAQSLSFSKGCVVYHSSCHDFF